MQCVSTCEASIKATRRDKYLSGVSLDLQVADLNNSFFVLGIAEGDAWTVMDLHSTNKTKLIRKRDDEVRTKESNKEEGEEGEIVLEGDVKHKLRDGDILMFADIQANFYILSSQSRKKGKEGDDKKLKRSHRSNSVKTKQTKDKSKETKSRGTKHKRTVSEAFTDTSFLLDQSLLLSSSSSSSSTLNVRI